MILIVRSYVGFRPACAKNSLGEGERLPSNTVEMSKILDIKGYSIVIIYTDKALDTCENGWIISLLIGVNCIYFKAPPVTTILYLFIL